MRSTVSSTHQLIRSLCDGHPLRSYRTISTAPSQTYGLSLLQCEFHFPAKKIPPKNSRQNRSQRLTRCRWEIFTYGEAPYVGLSNVDAVEAVMRKGLRLSKPTNCPDELYDIMLKCWLPDPTLRPSFNSIWQCLTVMIDDRREDLPPVVVHGRVMPRTEQVHSGRHRLKLMRTGAHVYGSAESSAARRGQIHEDGRSRDTIYKNQLWC